MFLIMPSTNIPQSILLRWKNGQQSSNRHVKEASANELCNCVLSNFINLTQVHNFMFSAQDIFTFRRLSVFTVSLREFCKY